MKPDVNIFKHPDSMAESLAEEFYRHVMQQFLLKKKICIALSGGNTPLLFFRKLSDFDQQKMNKVDWTRIHIFWGDERCVSPDHKDSNFGNTNKVLLSRINIPETNIHRIYGENPPDEEVIRYSKELQRFVPEKNGKPLFDWVFLGIGTDGHTASIFPDNLDLFRSEADCVVVRFSDSAPPRITLTGQVLNNAKRVTFIVSGSEKQEIIKNILNNESSAKKYPAAGIKPVDGILDLYLDTRAAEGI